MKIVIFIAIFLIILLAVCAFAYMVMEGGKAATKKRRNRPKPWRVELEDRNTTTEAWLCQGDYKEFFGATDRMADGYADRLITLETAAEDRALERNTARKVLNQ